MSDATFLVGEPVALDLVNTRAADGDLLVTPDDLRVWAGLQVDRVPEAGDLAAGATDEDLAAVRAVRDGAAHAIGRVREGEAPSPDDLDVLNRAQRAAPAIAELAWDGGAVTVTRRRGGPAGTRLAAALAEATADLLADPAAARIRECEADDCVMLFLPAHPRRRWCSAARCGNRVRVARHYQRHKAS
ncbi:CGNR zinc finger domain-containing protein [Actinomadura fibrosa]|uniref:CGNR zinc finger domain-containing protein n=1 Tax=Actinomadura fibrosa TaxID=111802 RepID=A0ABW2XKY8_9ACTN|nr:CGNR zinc finger domain-containing protein [Actinomadura fibrosa]